MQQITLTASQNVLLNHIIQINMCSKCPSPARMISDGCATGQSQPRSVHSQPKLASSVYADHRCHKSLFRTRIAAQHPKLYNLQAHFDKACTIHLIQFSLLISHGNVTFSLFWFSQGSVATLIRWSGWSSCRHMYRSSLNLTVKTALKSVDFSWRRRQKYVGSFLWLRFRKMSSALRRRATITVHDWSLSSPLDNELPLVADARKRNHKTKSVCRTAWTRPTMKHSAECSFIVCSQPRLACIHALQDTGSNSSSSSSLNGLRFNDKTLARRCNQQELWCYGVHSDNRLRRNIVHRRFTAYLNVVVITYTVYGKDTAIF